MLFAWQIAFPKPITLYGGLPGKAYCYDVIVKWLEPRLEKTTGRIVLVPPSDGSNSNIPALKKGNADLAVTHVGANSLPGKEVAIVAPLYCGPLYVVVRQSSGITEFSQLRGRKISLGPLSLGMRDAAQTTLEYHGIGLDEIYPETRDVIFQRFLEDPSIDGAIITTGWECSDFERLLIEELVPRGARFRFLSLPRAEELDAKQSFRFQQTEFRSSDGQEITTLRSPVILATRADESDEFVTKVLETLYQQNGSPPPPYLMSRKEAAAWVKTQVFGVHQAAKDYFQITDTSLQGR